MDSSFRTMESVSRADSTSPTESTSSVESISSVESKPPVESKFPAEPLPPTEAGDYVSVEVEFHGGLDMLFGTKKIPAFPLPRRDDNGRNTDIQYLVKYLCENKMKDPRKYLFIENDEYQVRSGILVLINDADWELEGKERCELGQTEKKKDLIIFMSTLHGG